MSAESILTGTEKFKNHFPWNQIIGRYMYDCFDDE